MFLDRLLWKRPYSGIHKACYSIGATKETEGPESGWELELGGGDETPCLDGLLSDKHILDMGIHDRTQATAHLLGEAVLDQWSEFFDTLSSSLPSEPAETTALFWQVQQCLERNLACSIFRSRMTGSPHSDAALWEPLLERVKRQVALLGQLTPSVTDIAMPSQEAQASQSPSGGGGTQGGGGGLGGGAKTPGSGGSDDDEHKRALDRLSYLGGVLLPFSIIPGILSLADPFGPTNNLFWVFWVITIPLVILTLIVIYADSIRKSEVWIEVAAATASEPDSTAPVAAEPNPGADPEKGEGSPAPLTGLEPSNRLFPEGPSRQKHPGPPFLHGPRWPLGPPQGSRVVVEPEWYSKLSPEARRTMWEKKELGWLGACKTLLRVYRLQDMQESADKVKGAGDVDEFPTVVPKKTRSFPF